MKEKYGKEGFQVIGIHSPEFDFEKKRSRVEGAVKKYHLDHPIMMDNDHTYWKALGNRYWPTFYLVDKGLRYKGPAAPYQDCKTLPYGPIFR